MQTDSSCCIVDDGTQSKKDYWDANFKKLITPNWIETEDPWILPWIKQSNLPKDALIFCAGVGNSNLVESLLNLGFTNIIANDISKVAIEKLKSTIPQDNVTYLVDDLLAPKQIQSYFGKVDLYIDRATLHFFTSCPEKDHYFSQMKNLLKPLGYSMIGVFSKDNQARCCGLDLQLWSRDSLQSRLKEYKHIDASEQSFIELNGNKRNYIYLFSQKNI